MQKITIKTRFSDILALPAEADTETRIAMYDYGISPTTDGLIIACKAMPAHIREMSDQHGSAPYTESWVDVDGAVITVDDAAMIAAGILTRREIAVFVADASKV